MKKQKPVLVLQSFVAGLVYGDIDCSQLSKQIKRGDQLLLVAEPTNEHDGDAILLVLKRGNKRAVRVGYIPKSNTLDLHVYREAGVPMHCIVKQVVPSNPTHRAVLFEVYAKHNIADHSIIKNEILVK